MKRAFFLLLALGAAAPAPATADPAPIGHRKTAWASRRFARHRKAAMRFGDEYRRFLSAKKTEREVVGAALEKAKAAGFRDLFAAERPEVKPGARLYAAVHGKLAALIVVGRRPLGEGVHVVASHVDAVRIDLKQNPVYADGNLALLQTHYYGGIKRYQWLSEPLELRGVVVKKDGKVLRVAIGDDPDEPVLVIPDVAVHVAGHVDREEGEQVPGESLDPIVSSTPARSPRGGADRFAAAAARLLEKRYRITPAELASAELELVPAGPARDVGVDRALVGGYGQDDRACTYAAMRALLAQKTPRHTAIVVLADKEEIGSAGNTGARSNFIRRVVAELIEGAGGTSTEAAMSDALSSSIVFSADVTGAVNPPYRELYEKRNAVFVGSGVVWDQSAVHAELMSYVRRLLDKAGVTYQVGEWEKSYGSKGDSGTLLPYFTRHGMSGINVSIPLLSMHAPFEVVSKADLYEAYRAYRAFLAD